MSLYSPHWYRAAELKPRLKRHCDIARQVHRNRVWYVVANRTSGEFFRVTPPAYVMIGLMNGRRTTEQIWREAASALGDDLPTQDEVVILLARLHQADLLDPGTTPDIRELAERRKTRERKRLQQMLSSPFAIRVPLFDPDPFLSATYPFVRWIFTPICAAGFLCLLAYAAIEAALHWPELSSDLLSHVNATSGLLLVVLLYPLLKALHELGHGYAVKHWGGEVREMGVMFLFLMPVPYVDASAATIMPGKYQRALVSAMGIVVELAVASVSLLVWVAVEPGWVSAVAFTLIAIGGLSTLIFNGNPLLRFDGYYAMADLVEIPNLMQRSNAYLGYLVKRYGFAMKNEQFPVLADGEAPWLAGYSILAYFYRLSLAIAIAILVSGWLFELGLLLALWALFQMVLLPAFKTMGYLMTHETLSRVRRRALATSYGAAIAAIALLMLLPVPYGKVLQGVVPSGEGQTVIATGSGFIADAAIAPGREVERGQLIYRLENRRLSAQLAGARAQFTALQATLEAERSRSPAAAERAREQLAQAQANVDSLERKIAELSIRSPASGTYTVIDQRMAEGRYVEQGETLGYIIQPDEPLTLRIVTPESDSDLVKERQTAVAVRFPHLPGQVFKARIVRELPRVGQTLPSAAFSTLGRGAFPLDPSDPGSLKTLTRFTIFEAELEDPPPNRFVGAMADVRIDLGWAPIGIQLSRPILQTLLKSVAG